jgi:beta-galactosidase
MNYRPVSIFDLGCAYYPDYILDGDSCCTAEGIKNSVSWKERIDEDFRRMKNVGLRFVRMGEFSWATVEPEPENFAFERFHAALDLADEHDLGVIFCTPTATPPKWLIDKHPDILPITRQGNRIPFGSRRHYDVCHPEFVSHSNRISQRFACEFGLHPRVIGWQIDNEFGCHNSLFAFGAHTRDAFQKWLERKYGSIDALNQEWFTCFWSQRYTSFAQVELPYQSWADQNPHLELDFRRFSNDAYAAFQNMQCRVVRENSPGRFITHNFMSLFTDLCPWLLSADLDVAGFDHYQMQQEVTPTSSSWQFSLMRSLKDKPFVVLEQQPLQVNWQPINRRLDYDWLFLWGMQAAFHGASAMYYFSWQRMYGGAEQYHDGIVPHDVRVPQSWQERVIAAKSRAFELMAAHFDLNEMPHPADDVLCIHNFESYWTHEICSQSVAYSTHYHLDLVAELCHSAGLGLGFARTIADAQDSMFRHKLVILPGYAFEFTEAEKELLRKYLESGGKVLSFPRTAMKKTNNQMSRKPLDLFFDDFYFDDYGALLPGEHDTFSAEQMLFRGTLWAERIKITSTQWCPLAEFQSGLYAGSPACLANRSFKNGGMYVHFACVPENTAELKRWLLSVLSLPAYVEEVDSTEVQIVPLVSKARRFLSAVNFGNSPCTVKFRASISSILVAALDANQNLICSQNRFAELIEAIEIGPRQAVLAEVDSR